MIPLADDIARNMSAPSARVATIPGRSVIGIELPNPKRETVVLSELIGIQASKTSTRRCPDPGQEYRRRSRYRRSGADAASARRGHHRVGQIGRAQLHDPVADLPDDAGPVPHDHDRSEDARTEHVRGYPASPVPGGDRAGQGDSRAQMDGRADGGALPDDGDRSGCAASQLQREGARGQGQGRGARAAGADRL